MALAAQHTAPAAPPAPAAVALTPTLAGQMRLRVGPATVTAAVPAAAAAAQVPEALLVPAGMGSVAICSAVFPADATPRLRQ